MKKKICMSLLLCIPLLWGGFYEFVSALLSCVIVICIIYKVKEKQCMNIYRNSNTVLLLIIFGLVLASPFYALDKGSAMIGIIKYLPIILFYFLWHQMNEEEKDIVWNFIPASGTVMVTISCVCYFVSGLRGYFFRADRLGGFFQYSNTFALYLLIGIVVLAYHNILQKKDYVELGILFFGIIISGSRSIFILLIANMIYLILRQKSRRGFYLAGVVIVGTAAGLFAIVTKQLTTLSRLFQISVHSSTLLGRILYWKDAFSLIKKHPMGLGYLGYYYIQPQIQTGNYIVKYVHNDWIQIALDIGILAALVVFILFLNNFISKNNCIRNRHILLIIALHCCFDFDIEFISIAMIAIMCLKEDGKGMQVHHIKLVPIMGAFVVAICGYFVAALGTSYFGQYHLANQIFPYNTLSLEREMEQKAQDSNVKYLAEKVVKQNGTRASAYATLMMTELEKSNYKKVVCDGDCLLKNAGYQMEYYEQYVVILSKALDKALKEENMEEAQHILTYIQQVPDQISALKSRTSELAYKTVDAPDFSMDQSVEEYVDSLLDISLYQ